MGAPRIRVLLRLSKEGKGKRNWKFEGMSGKKIKNSFPSFFPSLPGRQYCHNMIRRAGGT